MKPNGHEQTLIAWKDQSMCQVLRKPSLKKAKFWTDQIIDRSRSGQTKFLADQVLGRPKSGQTKFWADQVMERSKEYPKPYRRIRSTCNITLTNSYEYLFTIVSSKFTWFFLTLYSRQDILDCPVAARCSSTHAICSFHYEHKLAKTVLIFCHLLLNFALNYHFDPLMELSSSCLTY